MNDLLTIDDIASMLRASRRTVAERWIHLPDFPRPRFAPSRWHRLWARDDVLRWAQRDLQATGAPAAPRCSPASPGSSSGTALASPGAR
jgi:hypothetical protein